MQTTKPLLSGFWTSTAIRKTSQVYFRRNLPPNRQRKRLVNQNPQLQQTKSNRMADRPERNHYDPKTNHHLPPAVQCHPNTGPTQKISYWHHISRTTNYPIGDRSPYALSGFRRITGPPDRVDRQHDCGPLHCRTIPDAGLKTCSGTN